MIVDVLRWVRQHKLSAAALVVVVAGCIALVLLARRVHHLRPRLAVSAVASTSAAAMPGRAASDAAGAGQGSRSTAMRAGFENAPRYVDFIRHAMTRPQEGGSFYALLAWRRCNDLPARPDVAPTPTGGDAFHDSAVALVEDVGRRCEDVQRAWADLPALFRVVMAQPGGRDALVPGDGRGFVTPTRPETADADLDAAIRTGDRWAQAESLRDNADWLEAGTLDADDGHARQLRAWAAGTVACELVGNCRGGLPSALHCVATGDCTLDDDRDVLRAEVPESEQILFDTLVEGIHRRMGLAPGRPSPEGDAK